MPLALDSQEQKVCGVLFKHSVMTLLQRSPPVNLRPKMELVYPGLPIITLHQLLLRRGWNIPVYSELD